jgi:hypothetical protein
VGYCFVPTRIIGELFRGTIERSARYFDQQLSACLAHAFDHFVAAGHCCGTAFFDERGLFIEAFDPLQLYQFGCRAWLLIEL